MKNHKTRRTGFALFSETKATMFNKFEKHNLECGFDK